MVLQTGLNMDYGADLDVDGIWDLRQSGHWAVIMYAGRVSVHGDSLEILLMLKCYNPQGVECPGSFGSGLEAAVRQYQRDHGLTVDGIAGYKTFKSLL